MKGCRYAFANDYFFYDGQACSHGTNFWLDEVTCIGTELRLVDCSHDDWGVSDCNASECVKVACIE